MNLSDILGSMFGQSTQPTPTPVAGTSMLPSFTEPQDVKPLDPGEGVRLDGSDTDKKPGGDRWKNLAAQLQFANSIAQLGRGMYSDLSRGPGGSPIAAPRVPQAAAFQPTAYGAGGGGMRLSDLMTRRA